MIIRNYFCFLTSRFATAISASISSAGSCPASEFSSFSCNGAGMFSSKNSAGVMPKYSHI